MKTQSRSTFLILVSALALSACQTSILQNQITQTTDLPVVEVVLDSDGDDVTDELDMCPNTQQNAVVDVRGCQFTTGPEMGLKMEPRVFFEKGSSEVSPNYFSQLDQVGIKMREFDTATMRIEGSVSEDEVDDSSLTATSNSLAKNRAMIVKSYLMMHQIKPERITTFDCGARAPIAANDTKEGRAMNRRIYGLVTRSDEDLIDIYKKYSNSSRCIEF